MESEYRIYINQNQNSSPDHISPVVLFEIWSNSKTTNGTPTLRTLMANYANMPMHHAVISKGEKHEKI